jgi:succinyl-CoA synthetase beta subunit
LLLIKVNVGLVSGTNVNEAKKLLSESGLPILTASDLDEAAKKAVGSIKK